MLQWQLASNQLQRLIRRKKKKMCDVISTMKFLKGIIWFKIINQEHGYEDFN